MTKEELENYEPKGDLKGFPKEIIIRMLECQEKQGNPRNISVFERNRTEGELAKGFVWSKTKEGYDFWNEVIRYKNFNHFFEKYPKQYNSQEFRVGDKVIDIITRQRGKIFKVSTNDGDTFHIFVSFNEEDEIYTLDGRYYGNDKYPRLLHYRDDYDYDVIDFNNLPKRQNFKRWRANRHSGYWIIDNFFEVYEFEENNTDTDDTYNNLGNYFQTKEEAQEVADKLNKCFQELINK